MPDPNMRLKAVLHDAKMICRHKLLLVREELPENEEEIDRLTGDTKEVFRKFDQMDTWTSPIEFDEILIRQRIIELHRAEESDLPAFSEKINALLESLRAISPEAPRSRSLLGNLNSLNPQMVEALLRNQRLIDDIFEKFRLSGTNLGDIPDYVEAEEKQRELVNNYMEKLQNNELQANSVDLEIVSAIWGGIFEKMNAELPGTEKYIETNIDYNEDIEGLSSLA